MDTDKLISIEGIDPITDHLIQFACSLILLMGFIFAGIIFYYSILRSKD